MRSVRPLSILVALLLFASAPADALAARGKSKGKTDAAPDRAVPVASWLVLGPVPHPLPAFGDAAHGTYDLERLLGEATLPVHSIEPEADQAVPWLVGNPLNWSVADAAGTGQVALAPPEGSAGPATAWLASYVTNDRFVELELVVLGAHPRRVWVDGRPVAQGGLESADGEVKGKVRLIPGKHRLLLQTILDPERKERWSAGVRLGHDADGAPPVSVTLLPERDVELRDILDAPIITSAALAPYGRQMGITVSRITPGTHDRESWVEIFDTMRVGRLETWRAGTNVRQLGWSLSGRFLAFVNDDAPPKDGQGEKTSTLYVFDRSTRHTLPLVERVPRLGGYLWSPTNEALVYSVTEPAEKDERGIKRLEGLLDRQNGFRDKQVLVLATVPGGARRRITAGDTSVAALDFTQDGRRLLFSRQIEDLSARPYERTELWEIELETLAARKLRDFRWFGSASYSPDDERLLVTCGATEFGEAGLTVPAGVAPNLYDTQVFIWNPATDEADPITRDFAPSIELAVWNPYDQRIYLRVKEGDRVKVYRYHVEERTFAEILAPFDVVDVLDVGELGPFALATGSSAWQPQGVALLRLDGPEPTVFPHPADEWFKHVKPGSVEPWSFTAASGRTIDGRVYFPRDFDPARQYPAIVYYYGGTNPVERDFGGRYPKEWWAANGYVVYVMQPSGATGYGQEFSATHVNDWGRTTAGEIVEGTRQFLAAHPYVDPKRVGAIGASYGGFMTMLLSTQSDLFAAAVAHAGISSLASYWGEGYWGYGYSAVATADSFPWNRRDIYVDQSPLFRADQARVPILLTHGRADTNVPVGESDAFYIALKLLGKPVEYLQVEGADHWILEHKQREAWSGAILAWFDKWLKGRPEWWDRVYVEQADKKAE